MPSAQRTIVINRPVGEVFAFLTDMANDKKWRTHVKEIGTQGSMGVGTVVKQVVHGPMGRGIPADFEVTEFEPNSRFAFQVTAGPVRPRGAFTFTPSGDDATSVSFSLDAELTGIKKLLMGKPVQKSMDGEAASLDKAKQLIETG